MWYLVCEIFCADRSWLNLRSWHVWWGPWWTPRRSWRPSSTAELLAAEELSGTSTWLEPMLNVYSVPGRSEFDCFGWEVPSSESVSSSLIARNRSWSIAPSSRGPNVESLGLQLLCFIRVESAKYSHSEERISTLVWHGDLHTYFRVVQPLSTCVSVQ